MSLASLNSSVSKKSSSVKSTQEYRSLRQQLFHLQSTHSSLKLLHERESMASATKRAQLQEEINSLKEQVDELRKDQVYILNSEREAIETVETLKAQGEEAQINFTAKLKCLEESLARERDMKYSLETELTKVKLLIGKSEPIDSNEFGVLLNEWKDRVLFLTNRNNSLESEIESLKQQLQTETSNLSPSGIVDPSNDPETLRQKILSTYVSLESAQTVLNQKRAEADRLIQRIGNVKILEEKYRDALIRIKRLEGSGSCTESPSQSPPSPAPSTTELKLIELTREMGNLKESLALASLNHSSLQSELEVSKTETVKTRIELEESKRTILKLQNNLKVKDSAVASLKEQLDSTVNLLTETLKKKKTPQ